MLVFQDFVHNRMPFSITRNGAEELEQHASLNGLRVSARF